MRFSHTLDIPLDAITVVKTLGQHCLREDKYCFDQRDQEENHEQIQDMGRIYEGATLIIAVITRVRDEDGLAGVGSTCAFVDKRKLAWELEMVYSRLDVS